MTLVMKALSSIIHFAIHQYPRNKYTEPDNTHSYLHPFSEEHMFEVKGFACFQKFS